MGYRPTFESMSVENFEFYGTKLFGYVEHEKCASFQYLKYLGLFDEDVIFDYGFENEIILTYKQFLVFFYLYEMDVQRYRDEKFTWDTEFNGLAKAIAYTEGSKRIYWC